jgi:Cu+-exporting ATPase
MNFQEQIATTPAVACFHCGELIRDGAILHEDKTFCCAGCKIVFELLQQSNLQEYYTFYDAPGRAATFAHDEHFAYLDEQQIALRLKDFTDGTTSTVTFVIPQMHCASCVWLLERLYSIDQGILQSRVDFLKKQIHIQYTELSTSLRKIVQLLASLGYEPLITLDVLDKKPESISVRPMYYRIGIAGFCFGNIMLFSFPEYLASHDVDPQFQAIFSLLSLVLALPVLLYSASDYFLSAVRGLRKGIVNLDFPIALGIAILFLRSLYEIGSHAGPGYLDSMTGLVFFLLIGKLFQNKTYERLNFERDYRSYFPLGVTVLRHGTEHTIPIAMLGAGERILLRNNELIPADAVLIQGHGTIDYSFVTGEARTVDILPGAIVYAGGRQTGSAIEMEVVKPVSQSYLTQLWKDAPPLSKCEATTSRIANTTGKYFTAAVLLLAAIAALLWMPTDPARGWNAITAILIVACPCALALATPFTFGTTLRIFGQNGFYLKNVAVIESLARITRIVFDKTGTITRSNHTRADFHGAHLTPREEGLVASLVRNSCHPLSQTIFSAVRDAQMSPPAEFVELPGKGIRGTVDNIAVRLGSADFVAGKFEIDERADTLTDTRVYLSLDGSVRGHFTIHNEYRDGLSSLIAQLKRSYTLHVISGDTAGERPMLEELFGKDVSLRFRQSPTEKLQFVRALQDEGASLAMIGDGLNDAGALLQSNVGIAVAEQISAFSPACDAILEAQAFHRLERFLEFCATSVRIVFVSFGISFVYNAIGLYFAFSGQLSPIVAAILMPSNSISVVAFTTLTVRAFARQRGLV